MQQNSPRRYALHELKQLTELAMRNRYACSHPCRVVRLRIFKNGAKHYVRQCIDCGKQGAAIKQFAALRECPEPDEYDESLHDDYIAGKRLEYEDYMRSDTWTSQRMRTMALYGGWCGVTTCTKRATEVHHLSYARLGYELPEDLVAICNDCHTTVHWFFVALPAEISP